MSVYADTALQMAATALLLWGLYEMGNVKLRGPVLAGISEALWVMVGVAHDVWGLAVLSLILAVVQARNAVHWSYQGKPW